LILAVNRALNGAMEPSLAVRGVIEGFYGPPYTFDQRRDLFRFLADAGLNTYVYAPKLDPLHRDRWREPYSAEFLKHFGELARIGETIGVRFVYALSPSQGFDPAAGDTALVQQKLHGLFEVGVRDFCLLFDDIAADAAAADADVQVDLIADTFAFLRQLDAGTTLCFISNFYTGTAEQLEADSSPFQALFPRPSSSYYRAYGRIPPEVPIMWTGPAVFTDRLGSAQAHAFQAFAGRPVLVWDNYPVNDTVLADELFLGPYGGRDATLGDSLRGILLNPMLQPQATKIPLWTAASFFSSGRGYDPESAWEEALSVASNGRGTGALRTLAQQFRSHPLIGDDRESAKLADAMGAFFSTRSAQSRAALDGLFAAYARNEEELESSLGNPALLAELREPAHKLSLLGDAGVLALRLLDLERSGQPFGVAELETAVATAAEIPWRVGANTPIPSALARLLGEHDARGADVFGDFFARVLEELRSAAARRR
jgi:hyaluronoglucosaminidase